MAVFFHGCPDCFDENTINNSNGMYMKDLFKKTKRIDQEIKDSSYNLITIWEHEFDRSADMKSISVEEFDLMTPINPREAFYGGRCETFKLIAKDVIARKIDVCSMYPAVQFFNPYPIGHPETILKPNYFDRNWFGLINCRVIPPKKLYLPVLPYRTDKLIFGLCRTCMDESTNNKCNHSDDERAITGIWTTEEVKKAIEKGYFIDKIYEVKHFKKSTDLFKNYIRKYLKIKLETSFDPNSINESSITAFQSVNESEYREKSLSLGIELGELKANPGKRFISKLCLNSLWGKFGQRDDLKRSKYCETLQEYYGIVLNDKLKNINIDFPTDNLAFLQYNFKDEYSKGNNATNIYVAIFTTSHARLRLYEMMEKIGKNILYVDTDSCVYIEDESMNSRISPIHELVENQFHCFHEAKKNNFGNSLGEWSDELKGNYIKFWCSNGPKDYGYIDNEDKSYGKVKGFKINGETEEKMTLEARIKLIQDHIIGEKNSINIKSKHFKLDKRGTIHTQEMVKKWKCDFTKRVICQPSEKMLDSLPYGF